MTSIGSMFFRLGRRDAEEPNLYEKWFYDYRVNSRNLNTLCICVKKGSRTNAELAEIQSILDIPLYGSLKREDCPEE